MPLAFKFCDGGKQNFAFANPRRCRQTLEQSSTVKGRGPSHPLQDRCERECRTVRFRMQQIPFAWA